MRRDIDIEERLRRGVRRLPVAVQRRLESAVGSLPRTLKERIGRRLEPRAPRRARWGNLRRREPFDRNWGFRRGTPIDRIYIETFLRAHADEVRGDCLEILNANYTRRFGAARVGRSEILDIDPANVAATIVADLGEPESLPSERFDCFVLTQTLHLIPDMDAALDNVWRTLRPGGILLVTVPAAGRHEGRSGVVPDRWRVTPAGMESLLHRHPWIDVDISSYGNIVSTIAFLHGLSARELRPSELELSDPDFPVIVGASARKPPPA